MRFSRDSAEARRLIAAARAARRHAYAPYSRIRVGAAVLTTDDQVYGGANIENASYGLSNCAERTAIFKAVSEGHRHLRALAIVTPSADECWPCGACRQVMLQFNARLPLLLAPLQGELRLVSLAALLPRPFWPRGLRIHASA
jgi:cytidine deaminase